METNPNYELLKQAYAIIDGIPETAIALGGIRTKEGATLAEGTVCSPEGWLALHPTFNEHGLTMSADGKELRFNGEADSGAVTNSTRWSTRMYGFVSEPVALQTYVKMPLNGQRHCLY